MPEAQIPIFEMIDAKMKMIPLLTAAILMGTILPAISAVPIKQPLGRYAELWTDSPFTVKPPIDAPEVEEENPLDDLGWRLQDEGRLVRGLDQQEGSQRAGAHSARS
jgi:hypothetical protein